MRGEAARPPLAKFCAETWVPSRFNVSVDLDDGRRAVFNTFSAAFAIVRDDVWRRHLDAGAEWNVSAGTAPETPRLLSSRGFLVPKDIEELDLVRLHFLSGRFSDDALGVTIAPTLACDLRCGYCFEGKAQTEHGAAVTMSAETADAAIVFVAAWAAGKKGLDVCWFGGEPLLATDTICGISSKLVPACDKAGLKYSASLLTNGTHLGPDTVERLEGCRLRFIQVTVDVPASEKRDSRGRETQDGVLDNLRAAADRLPVHLRVNLVRDDEAEFDRLYEGLLRRGLEAGLKSVNLAGLVSPECGRKGCEFRPVSHRSCTEAFARERGKARALGLPVETLSLRGPTGCTATSGASVAIGPDGLLYKCLEDVGLAERAYGSVHSPAQAKAANLLPWLTHDWLKHDACRRCPALPECSGGCAHIRMFQPGNFGDGEFCRWHLRDLKNRIREHALDAGARGRRRGTDAPPGKEGAAG